MRFGLLSYIVAILLLTVVLGVNLTARSVENASRSRATLREDLRRRYFGWPLVAVEVGEARTYGPSAKRARWVAFIRLWHYRALAANIAFGLALPLAGLVGCEMLLRRRVRKKRVG